MQNSDIVPEICCLVAKNMVKLEIDIRYLIVADLGFDEFSRRLDRCLPRLYSHELISSDYFFIFEELILALVCANFFALLENL